MPSNTGICLPSTISNCNESESCGSRDCNLYRINVPGFVDIERLLKMVFGVCAEVVASPERQPDQIESFAANERISKPLIKIRWGII